MADRIRINPFFYANRWILHIRSLEQIRRKNKKNKTENEMTTLEGK